MDHDHHYFHKFYEKSIRKFTLYQVFMRTMITCSKGNWCYVTRENEIFNKTTFYINA